MIHGIRTGWSDFDRAFAEMNSFRRDMDRAVAARARRPVAWVQRAAGPEADLYDAGEAFVVTVDVPGLAAETLDLQVTPTGLTLSGQRGIEVPEGFQAHRRERRPFGFTRTFAFPVKVEVEQATAALENGVLTVRLPKAAEVQPRRIPVQG